MVIAVKPARAARLENRAVRGKELIRQGTQAAQRPTLRRAGKPVHTTRRFDRRSDERKPPPMNQAGLPASPAACGWAAFHGYGSSSVIERMSRFTALYLAPFVGVTRRVKDCSLP